MNAVYESKKRIALGLDRGKVIDLGDDMWNVDLGSDFHSVKGELPFQFFERGFEMEEELTGHKVALSLYSPDYADDCRDAEKRLETLKQALAGSDKEALKDCLNEVHPEEWLSLIFLDGNKLKDELVPLLDDTSDDCRKIFGEALDKALSRLVNFKDLLQSLKSRC